jgi:hypothetical protein
MKLTKGIFGREFGPKVKTEFNLHSGQMRAGQGKMTHNSGWYNAAGEKLGWGDLSAEDFGRIRALLEPGQAFIVLPEHESFWSFVTEHKGHLGSHCPTSADAEAPGLEYIQEHMSYLVTQDAVFVITESRTGLFERDGTVFVQMPRSEACKQLKGI